MSRDPMFPTLSGPQIARLATCGVEQPTVAGSILFAQGDAATPMFVVLEGEVEAVHPRSRADLREDVVVVHGPGEFTGEMAMMSGRRTLLATRVRTAGRVLRIERADLLRVVQDDSELSDLFLRAFLLRRTALISKGKGDAVLIGSKHCGATLRLQEFLSRNNHPYVYVEVEDDPHVQEMLDGFEITVEDVPVLICRGERVLKRPTNAEVADCLGFNPDNDATIVRDVIVVGAGPAGLAAAVYAASEGLGVIVLESHAPGGQAGSSSKIENYLGFPTGISGQELAARAFTQAEKFGAAIMITRSALRLRCDRTPIEVDLSDGTTLLTRSLVIATGVQYHRPDLAELDRYDGLGVYYGATFVESQHCGEDEIAIVGGGNSAGQAAVFLARTAKHVHVVIRSAGLASSMSRYLVRRIEETPNITLHPLTEIVKLDGKSHLEGMTWRTKEGESHHPIRHLFLMTGATPNTHWLEGCLALDPRGFVVTGTSLLPEMLESWPKGRAPMLFETSMPGVFAVGDVRAESTKRVASAVGEGSVCISFVHRTLAE